MLPQRIQQHAMLSFALACLLFTACETQAVPAVADTLGPESRAGNVEPSADYEASLTALLQAVVTDEGLVRYDLLRGPLNLDFRRVLKAVETFDATTLRTDKQKLAYWMNAYNVQMLQNIIETPEVENIIDDGFGEAFFDTPFLTAGADITLNQIENVILRRQEGRAALNAFGPDRLDPRLHVGLNCAALSCPRLRRRAFTADHVDAELDAAMHDFAASPAHFRAEGDRLVLSSLLDWYGPDFDQPDLPAGDLILHYMPPTRPGYAALKKALAGRTSADLKTLPNVTFEYLWSVNRAD